MLRAASSIQAARTPTPLQQAGTRLVLGAEFSERLALRPIRRRRILAGAARERTRLDRGVVIFTLTALRILERRSHRRARGGHRTGACI